MAKPNTSNSPLAVPKFGIAVAVDNQAADKSGANFLHPDADHKSRDCSVFNISDTEIEVVFRIKDSTLARYKSRAGDQNLAVYLWENVLRRAVESHVY